jgi:hypothetical protein
MKSFYEAILAHGGFAGDVFDIAVGPPNVDVVDTLLSVGDTNITQNIPLNIISTGLLNGNRTLNIAGAEQNGRMFFLSMRNTDLGNFQVFITASTTINDDSQFIVNKPHDYLFVYETGGVWKVYRQRQPGDFSDIIVALDTGLINSSNQEVPTIVVDNQGNVVTAL